MIARKIRIKGIVQGVGFRPFIHRLAAEFDIAGFVLNDTEGVLIHAEGEPENVGRFVDAIPEMAPKPAHIAKIASEPVSILGRADFRIIPSEHREGEVTAISPDLATCEDCRAELFDPGDRRYGYPFINCTHCGPRYSIIENLPYDRPATSMSPFAMCQNCLAEYRDVQNRRFHAQPNACRECGPKYDLFDLAGLSVRCDDPIVFACEMLRDGKIIAVKGIGGFHLIADAANGEVVGKLRERKERPAKPFALMVRDIETVRKLCEVSDREAAILSSPAAPILLLKIKKSPALELPDNIAPGLDRLGIFLPYAPIHHLIFALSGIEILIATSGNKRDEPVSCQNDEALRDLKDIADAFLVHNREIVGRTDDSVGFVFDNELTIVRRSRGYVPRPVEMPISGASILAVGADLKGTFAMTRGSEAFLSPYLGDLTGEKSLELFDEVLSRYLKWLNIAPEAIVCDLHPDYASTILAERLAAEWGVPLFRLQHHAAHGISVIAEHKLPDKPALTVALDGYGYSSDGTIWGGEFLSVRHGGFERLAHIRHVPQPGGDRAAVDTRRMALSWAFEALGEKVIERIPDLLDDLSDLAGPLLSMIRCRRPPLTSSAGRLFDSVACLTGVCSRNTFEGECPQRLTAAADMFEMGHYEFATTDSILDPSPAIRRIIEDCSAGIDKGIIAARFHRGFARGIVDMAHKLAGDNGIGDVLLSGGVFQNPILLELVVKGLRGRGLRPYWNRIVPAGDAGIALGQALFGKKRFNSK